MIPRCPGCGKRDHFRIEEVEYEGDESSVVVKTVECIHCNYKATMTSHRITLPDAVRVGGRLD